MWAALLPNGNSVRVLVRVLTFRASGAEMLALGPRELVLGLICTWVAGMGRWRDDPTASLFMMSGLGSVAYVLALTSLLWLVIRPLDPYAFSWGNLLIFVTLTSPPAFLYAIPVEQWLSEGAALQLNLIFLQIVALWRLSLLCVYLRRSFSMSPIQVAMGAGIPIMGVIVVLGFTRMDYAVFDAMGGFRRGPLSPHRWEHEFLFGLGLLSLVGLLILGFIYVMTLVELHLVERVRTPRK